MDKPLIIFDTDMDTDCDDAGALAMLLHAHLQNKIELLGMVADSVCRYAAPCCEAIAESYGVSVPTGAIYAEDYAEEMRFDAYREHTKNCAEKGLDYNHVFADEIGKTDKDYPNAVTLYRKLLANAEEESVTVLCVGMLTAIAETLQSEPDEISLFSGTELFAKKVKKVICMGNPQKTPDFNWGMDAKSTVIFFRLCPAPIYISAEGKDVITGNHLTAELPETDLVRRAYEQWLKAPNTGRASWDLIASLYAIYADTSYIEVHDLGTCTYDAVSKITTVTKTDHPRCKTLHLTCSNTQAEIILNDCMLGNFYNI